jgi:hypothetical protein
MSSYLQCLHFSALQLCLPFGCWHLCAAVPLPATKYLKAKRLEVFFSLTMKTQLPTEHCLKFDIVWGFLDQFDMHKWSIPPWWSFAPTLVPSLFKVRPLNGHIKPPKNVRFELSDPNLVCLRDIFVVYRSNSNGFLGFLP